MNYACILYPDDDPYDGADLDIGYCPRCGRDMADEPPAAWACQDCLNNHPELN